MYYIAKPLSARFSRLAVDPWFAQGNRGLDRGHPWLDECRDGATGHYRIHEGRGASRRPALGIGIIAGLADAAALYQIGDTEQHDRTEQRHQQARDAEFGQRSADAD